MKKLVIGILAHVDAGKTTLSEALLYKSGTIRNLGRVDKGDAFLDTFELEKQRGITIFSKQAQIQTREVQLTLLDTPGHVDFSAETERSLQVLDYAILLISGADGVQGHTETLWRLLERYRIPTILFFNKMDQPGTNRERLLKEGMEKLSSNLLDFTKWGEEAFLENLAVYEEALLERFLEGTFTMIDGETQDFITDLISQRKMFPCLFGSALHMEGITELLTCLSRDTKQKDYGSQFAAKVYKISRDEQGNRLTFCKITGGQLRVRDTLRGDNWQEKVTQIRIYSGSKYQTVEVAEGGMICALTGLSETFPGEGIGEEHSAYVPILEPVMTFQLILPEGVDAAVMLPKIRQLEEEEPQLHVVWKEAVKEIHIQIMGDVQLEILKSMIWQRYAVDVSFGIGQIVYKETIENMVEGIGHFEPLRHYAEVHLLMEPLESGSGIQVATDCPEDELSRNWQRLILTHLEEREHRGVLTGSVITDMKITLVAGKAHLKHTEGGDFRQATYRAVRQGLMQAKSILLEPFYAFTLELPEQMVGRGMMDIERMHGQMEPPIVEHGIAILKGRAPVYGMQTYHKELMAYSKGQGRLQLVLDGYGPCHNTEEVLERLQYDPETDMNNPSGSVFCAHGAGFVVPWYQVPEYMHLESVLASPRLPYGDGQMAYEEEMIQRANRTMEARLKEHKGAEQITIGTREIEEILNRTGYANSQDKVGRRKWNAYSKAQYSYQESKIYGHEDRNPEKYLLVDGYNIIFAWQDLKELAEINIDSARGKLLDVLCNYQGIKNCRVIVVFDAYRVKGHETEVMDYHNIQVVYTKEAETADQYIEKYAHTNGRRYQVTVATSDGLEQVIIRGQGCLLLSARELQEEVVHATRQLREEYLEKQKSGNFYKAFEDIISPENI